MKRPTISYNGTRAAEYVRMSTDHQKYSTENQSRAIREYAEQRGYEIVRSYKDAGKSGVSVDGRDAFKQLIRDVQTGEAQFEVVLVYDISHWGRFQDMDEHGYYERICKRAKIKLEYCAEQFENDGSPVSGLVKGVKRAMAGIYSSDLSKKVFQGQRNLVERGYRQGGPAGYGIRRLLIDQAGAPKCELLRGEHKSLQTDRVVLVPGPQREVDVVRWIYRTFVEEERMEGEIAGLLNSEACTNDLGRAWTRSTIREVLTNEKYIGNNVWNRRSAKLDQPAVRNPPAEWVRADGVFQEIVSRELFLRAQTIFAKRAQRMSDEEMLAALARILAVHGRLSGILIDQADNVPPSSTYQSRFGSLVRAYSLVGYVTSRDYRYIEINRYLRGLYPRITTDIVAGIQEVGGTVVEDRSTDILEINDEFTTSVVIARCRQTSANRRSWHVRLDTSLRPDITLAVRMDESNAQPLDYYIFPKIDVELGLLRLGQYNGVWLDAYRAETLDTFTALCARISILSVAS